MLVVVCDHCGNREVGWGWHDKRRGGLRYDGEIEPPANLGYGTPDINDNDWADLKRQRGRLHGPPTERPMSAYVDDDDRLTAYCPKHGGIRTDEFVVGAEFDAGLAYPPVWVRARRRDYSE